MKVGDYVRFKDKRGNTYIRQIKDLSQDIRYGAIEIDIEANYSNMLSFKNIIKSSPNIIDLIEVGDIVNEEKIVGVGELTNGLEKGTKTIDYYIAPNTLYYFKNEDIKSIVTKEQFESMEYKI